MTYLEVLAKAREKAAAANTLLEDESPDMAKVGELQAEAQQLMERAKAMGVSKVLIDGADAATGTFNEVKAEKPVNAGLAQIKVIADEADKKAAARPYKSTGDFLMDIVKYQRNPNAPLEFRALQSEEADEDGYNLGKAIGFSKTASLSDMRKAAQAKAITGMSELVPADGGLLVQTDIPSTNLLSRMYNVGQLLQRVGMIGISANSNGLTLYGENETSRVDGSRRGGIRAYWACEGAEKTDSHPTFREINFKLQKLIGLVYATDELLQDAAALDGWVMQNLPEELRFVAESSILRGTGVGMPAGVIGHAASIDVPAEVGQATATIVTENIHNMWARRWGGVNDYIWLINQDCLPEILNLALAVGVGGQLVYMPPGGLSQAPYATLNGRPLIECEYCSTLGTSGDIILFSPSQYQMIDKGGIQSAVSIHVRFIYDEKVFRFVYRLDGKPLWSAPLTPYQGNNTQSPFLTLATRP